METSSRVGLIKGLLEFFFGPPNPPPLKHYLLASDDHFQQSYCLFLWDVLEKEHGISQAIVWLVFNFWAER